MRIGQSETAQTPAQRWAAMLVLAVLAACGGGSSDEGGSGGSGAQVQTLSGALAGADFTIDPGTEAATFSDLTGPGSTVSFELTEDGDDIVAITVTGPKGSFTLDTRNGDTITINGRGHLEFETQDASVSGYVVDTYGYQRFGSWNVLTGADDGEIGVASVGEATAVGSLPSGTSATYNGISRGFAVLADGRAHETESSITVDTDFSDVDITSSFTQAEDVVTGAGS